MHYIFAFLRTLFGGGWAYQLTAASAVVGPNMLAWIQRRAEAAGVPAADLPLGDVEWWWFTILGLVTLNVVFVVRLTDLTMSRIQVRPGPVLETKNGRVVCAQVANSTGKDVAVSPRLKRITGEDGSVLSLKRQDEVTEAPYLVLLSSQQASDKRKQGDAYVRAPFSLKAFDQSGKPVEVCELDSKNNRFVIRHEDGEMPFARQPCTLDIEFVGGGKPVTFKVSLQRTADGAFGVVPFRYPWERPPP